MPRKKYRQSSASTGPPQIIKVHFHPRERATSCWLRQEIRNVLLLVPFISTTGGWGSKESLLSPGTAAVGSASTWTPGLVRPEAGIPAAFHAAGFEIPAFTRAAAIFCCCDISTD